MKKYFANSFLEAVLRSLIVYRIVPARSVSCSRRDKIYCEEINAYVSLRQRY